jgi:hypothetical protein
MRKARRKAGLFCNLGKKKAGLAEKITEKCGHDRAGSSIRQAPLLNRGSVPANDATTCIKTLSIRTAGKNES